MVCESAPKYPSPLKEDILGTRRHYFIHKVKAPLMNAFIRSTKRYKLFAKIHLLIDIWRIVQSVSKYPEPTKENTKKPNTHALIDFWDGFEKFNTARIPLFRAIRRVGLSEYEHDDFYAERHDKYLWELMMAVRDGRYQMPLVHSPTTCWTDPIAIEKLALARMEYAVKGTVGGINVKAD